MTDESLRSNIQHGIDQLRQLRAEIRLEVHLGSMDVRDAWSKLEPELEQQLEKTQDLLGDTTDIGRRAVHDMVERVRVFKRDNIDGVPK